MSAFGKRNGVGGSRPSFGVAKPIGSVMGQSQDNFAYIPIQTYLAIYGARQGIDIFIQARGADWMERTQDEARIPGGVRTQEAGSGRSGEALGHAPMHPSSRPQRTTLMRA